MCKCKLVLIFVLGLVTICFSEKPVARFDQPILTSGTKYVGIYAISCSSNTATKVNLLNSERKGIAIYNDSVYIVYVATYPALETNGYRGLLKIKSDAVFDDNLEAYTSSWYVLGASTATVTVIEKW